MSDYQYTPSTEQWKEVPGFPGYEVSDRGNVRSYFRYGRLDRVFPPRAPIPQRYFLKNIDKDGYPKVSLRKDKKQLTRYVHRLVLEAFQGQCPVGMEACHNDGNKTNNVFPNLRWDTRASNIQDRFVLGERIGIVGATEKQTKIMFELRASGFSCRKIATMVGFSEGHIRKKLKIQG